MTRKREHHDDQVITGKARCERGARLTGTVGVSGIVSYVRPSRRRPAFFLFLPPHCLKKNATPAQTHWSRMSVTHAGAIGRARWPDSPPTMTQSMSFSFS